MFVYLAVIGTYAFPTRIVTPLRLRCPCLAAPAFVCALVFSPDVRALHVPPLMLPPLMLPPLLHPLFMRRPRCWP